MVEKGDKPLLTLSEVRGWQKHRDELLASVAAMTEEANALTQKIAAVKIIFGDLFTEDSSAGKDNAQPKLNFEPADKPAGAHSDESLSEAVLEAVAAIGGAPKPAAIRRWVATRYPTLGEKLAASSNYFYTVLGRHLHKGRLRKHGLGYRLPQGSPKGETGAVAAPVSTSTH